MAEEAAAATETSEEAEAPKGKKGGMLIAAVAAVASLAVGGGVGAFVVGPRLGGGTAADPGSEAHGAPAEEATGGGHGGESKASPVYDLDNLVVNPAGTNGQRFLIVSVAVQVSNSGLVETLNQHDAEIRDAVLHMLASRTVDELNDLAIRDVLKAEVRRKIESLIGAAAVKNVFLPQFVLQ